MPHQCTACGHTFEDGSKEMLSGCPDCGGNKFQFRPAGASDDAPTRDAGDSVGDTASDPASTDPTESGAPDSPPDPEPEPRPQVGDSSVAETVGRATTKVRDFVTSTPDPPTDDPNPDAEWPGEWEGTPPSGGGTSPDSDVDVDGDGEIIDADARRAARSDAPAENTAQASARTDVVSPSEIDADTAAERTEAPGADTDAAGGSTPASDTSTGPSPDASAPSTDAEPPETDPDAPPDGEVVGEPTGEEPDLTELREQLNDQFESIKILEPGQYELNLMELYDREEYIIALQENGRYVIQVPEQWIGEDPADR